MQKKKNIVYIDNFLAEHGRTPVTGFAMIKLLSSEGFNVVYASSKTNKLRRLADMLGTIWRHRKNSIVLIAVYSTSAFYFAWLCGKLCSRFYIPYITCLHGGNLPHRIKRSPLKSARLFGNASMNVAVSPYIHKSIVKKSWPAAIIPNFIRLEEYPFKVRGNCSPHILWVRSFHKIYQPEMALEIFAEILQHYPNAQLTMAGPDKDGSLQACKNKALSMGIHQQVQFTGLLPREEWIERSASFDIFLNTSAYDNLPVSIIEAMALGMPVVTTNAGGIPFLVDNYTNGIMIDKKNTAQAVAAILHILQDAGLAKKLSTHARETANKFDYPAIAAAWVQVIEQAS